MISEELAKKFEQNVSAKEKARLKRDRLAAVKILLEGLDKDDLKELGQILSKLEPEKLSSLITKLSDDQKLEVLRIISKALSEDQRLEALKLFDENKG
jgi:Mg/Co/Ni transporter MgtE